MTDDLIQRLRADAEFTDDIGLCADAADEIERLREELTALKQSPTMAAVREMITSQAVKENEKLREELATIKEQRDEAVSAVQRLTEGQPFDAVVIADGIKRGVAATLQKAIETEHAEEQKKIVMLREALESANSALEFSSHGAVKAIHKALEATQDLSGLILCEAEPVRYIYKFLDDKGRTILSMNLEREGQIPIATIPLYQARTL
jgi:hypothetical protein